MKHTRRKIILSIIITVIVIFVSATGAYALSIVSNFNHNEISQNDEDLGITQDDGANDITNIALFGVDTREEEFSGNSDSIMIISIDKQHNKVKLISILRDSLVDVDGYGKTKITEAYGLGGPVLAINTINRNFNLNIRDYATINFAGMAQIIDAVGGVTIDVSQAEINMLNQLATQEADQLGMPRPPKITQPGPQTLNGLQAVGYSRIRKIDNDNGSYGDFGRTDRQREVMEQLFEKAIAMSPTQYPSFIQKVLPYLETSLDMDEILELATILTRDNVAFEQTRVPIEEYTINPGYNYNGKSTVYYNLDFAADIIHAFIYDDIPQEVYLQTHEIPMTGSLGEDSETTSSNTQTAAKPKKQ